MLVAIEKRNNDNVIPIDEYKLFFITDELLTLLVTETNGLYSTTGHRWTTAYSQIAIASVERHQYNRELEMKRF